MARHRGSIQDGSDLHSLLKSPQMSIVNLNALIICIPDVWEVNSSYERLFSETFCIPNRCELMLTPDSSSV